LADLNDLGVLLHVLKAAGILYYSYEALWLAISFKTKPRLLEAEWWPSWKCVAILDFQMANQVNLI